MQVQNIACVNDAGFVMSFYVQVGNGLRTAGSGNYPIDQHRVIDLGDIGCGEGEDIWPVVSAVFGKTHSGSHVTFAKNGQTATYEVRGTTLSYSVTLIGGD